ASRAMMACVITGSTTLWWLRSDRTRRACRQHRRNQLPAEGSAENAVFDSTERLLNPVRAISGCHRLTRCFFAEDGEWAREPTTSNVRITKNLNRSLKQRVLFVGTL